MPTSGLKNEIEQAGHPVSRTASVHNAMEASALPFEDAGDVFDRQPHIRHSRISTKLHRFWEALALFSGTFLMVHGILGLIRADATDVWYFLSAFEACIGLVTIIVDGWFLTHV